MTLRILHGLWLIWIAIWAWRMEELRATILGKALLIPALVTLLVIAADELLSLRARLRRRPAPTGNRTPDTGHSPLTRRPWFTLQTCAGLVTIACGTFGLVECFTLDLPSETMVMLVNGKGPLSSWVFLVGGVFAVTIVYGAAVVAVGSGLLAARKVSLETSAAIPDFPPKTDNPTPVPDPTKSRSP